MNLLVLTSFPIFFPTQPFTSRPSSRSSSTSSSRPVKPIQSSRPRRPHRRSRSNSTSSLPSAHIRHSLLYSSSSPWSTHPGKTSATLGLITPSLDVLTWSLSLPHPHPSSYPRFKNSHRILLNSHRMYQTSLVLRNRNRSTTSNLAAPTTTLPTYPSPAGSDLTIRPSRPSSTHHPQNIPPSNFYSCSPPPFRSTIIPAFLSSRSSSRSYSSEADDDLAAFHHHPTIPTSYSSYLRAGESSPSSSSGERTPRASRASSRQGSTGGGASWEASPTATRRGGVAPSLSFTASTRASSVASMGSGSSPRDFFSGGGGGRMSSRSRAARREVELGDDEEALSPSPSYLTFGSLKKEGGSSIGGSRVVASTGTKRRDVSLSRAGGVASRRGKPTGAQRPIWR